MSNAETYERVTATLLSLIDGDDLLPWQKPWKGGQQWARSMSTKREYNGVNRWVLTITAQANGWSPWFGTYKQIAALGGQVKKGEKSTLAIYWSIKEKIDKDTGVKSKFAMLRTFNLFSASQAEGLPEKFYAKPEPTGTVSDDEAQTVFDTYVTTQGIPVVYGGSRASYSPKADRINLPEIGTFRSTEEFYGTAFHEATHSTGHESRLDRPDIQNFHHFGDEMYSREELVAELGAALILGTLGMDKPNVVANQAAYLKSWKSALASDPQALVWAAGRAEKAANLVLGVTPEPSVKADETA